LGESGSTRMTGGPEPDEPGRRSELRQLDAERGVEAVRARLQSRPLHRRADFRTCVKPVQKKGGHGRPLGSSCPRRLVRGRFRPRVRGSAPLSRRTGYRSGGGRCGWGGRGGTTNPTTASRSSTTSCSRACVPFYAARTARATPVSPCAISRSILPRAWCASAVCRFSSRRRRTSCSWHWLRTRSAYSRRKSSSATCGVSLTRPDKGLGLPTRLGFAASLLGERDRLRPQCVGRGVPADRYRRLVPRTVGRDHRCALRCARTSRTLWSLYVAGTTSVEGERSPPLP
jgi:hypothetical protein